VIKTPIWQTLTELESAGNRFSSLDELGSRSYMFRRDEVDRAELVISPPTTCIAQGLKVTMNIGLASAC
jgi:hypothetical protein